MKKHGLSKSERIKRKKDFQRVFQSGSTVLSSDKKLRAIYYLENLHECGGIKVAFAVHKKAGKAVWRNRVKRLLRESFRLNKRIFYSSVNPENDLLLVVFSLNSINEENYKKIYLKDLMSPVIDLMEKIKGSIE